MMRNRWFVALVAASFTIAACSGGGGGTQRPTTTGTPAGSAPASEPAGSADTSPAGSGPTGAFDCGPGSGDLKLAGFSAGNVEEGILRGVLDTFEETCPNYTVQFEVIAGEYPNVMLPRLGSGDAPDLFYVQQGYAQDWITQELLQPLDERISAAGFDLAPFFPGYLAPFQQDGQTYGIPKDSSVLGMQTNDTLLSEADVEIPATVEELEAAARTLKESGVETPMCFAAEYARAGAFIEAFGGGMLNDDRSAPAIDSPESREGLDWYIRMYEEGLAKYPAQIGADWCGQAFFQEDVAIAFEGNWIGPAVTENAPELAYTVSPIPQATEEATLSFTAAYAYSPDSPNPDGSWALLSFLTSQAGQQEWVDGGLVLPSRDDVDVTEESLVKYAPFAEVAQAGEGLVPGWSAIQDAFNGALRNAADGAGTTDDVINATLPAIQSALGQ